LLDHKKIITISGAGPSAITRWKKQYLAEINGQGKTNMISKNIYQPKYKEMVEKTAVNWLELDDLTDSIVACMPNANRSDVYRTLVCFGDKSQPHDRTYQGRYQMPPPLL
jgi:hypothetical protein